MTDPEEERLAIDHLKQDILSMPKTLKIEIYPTRVAIFKITGDFLSYVVEEFVIENKKD